MAHPQDIGLQQVGEQEITFEVLASLFHLPLSMAAQQLGVCCTALKKKCRKNGISRWPYRTLQSIDKMIKAIETSPQNERANIELEYLQSKRDVIMRKPNFANKSPPRHRAADLDVKKTIAKPSYSTRRSVTPSNPLDVLQEAAKYADTTGNRRLAPATPISQMTAEPRLQYNPHRHQAQQQLIQPQPQQQSRHQLPQAYEQQQQLLPQIPQIPQIQPQQQVAGYGQGYYLQPVAASYSTSQTYAQAGHQFSMHHSVTTHTPQGAQKQQQQQQQQQQQGPQQVPQQVQQRGYTLLPAQNSQLPQLAQAQHSCYSSQHAVPQQLQPQQQGSAQRVAFTFHDSKPPQVRRSVGEKAVAKGAPASASPPQSQWNFELPKLRLSDDGDVGHALPKLRTLEPSAFASLRSAVETTRA